VQPTTHERDLVMPYVEDLRNVVDTDAIRAAGLALAVDPLGGAAVHYWEPINRVYGLDITVVNPTVDPQFGFMTVDHDGQIRMDCSSPYAMARLVGLKDKYRVAFANDPDSDRHGIVTPSAGLMNRTTILRSRSTICWAPPAVVGAGDHRQDPRLEQHDRSRRRAPRSAVVRSAGRLQVVYAWTFRRLARFGGEESAGRASCAATAPCGRPTRTARS
jgi:hypothetical protein